VVGGSGSTAGRARYRADGSCARADADLNAGEGAGEVGAEGGEQAAAEEPIEFVGDGGAVGGDMEDAPAEGGEGGAGGKVGGHVGFPQLDEVPEASLDGCRVLTGGLDELADADINHAARPA